MQGVPKNFNETIQNRPANNHHNVNHNLNRNHHQNQQNHQQLLAARAPGLDFIHRLCAQIYPNQTNPLTVTAVVKYWLGGPDPLDYISMYENPGVPELGVPPHWHYLSFGLSDLHGDDRLHIRKPNGPSGYGFELTFRLIRLPDENTPPTWPAKMLQLLAQYVFLTNNRLMPGDHVSWHKPLDEIPGGKIEHILLARDPQLPYQAQSPLGELSFVQIIGITAEELKVAQHWNGAGMVNVLKTTRHFTPWLITDMRRSRSIMEEDPLVAAKIEDAIEREGSNLTGVTAKCWWVAINPNLKDESYREQNKDDSDEEIDVKPKIKTERLSPCEQEENQEKNENSIKYLPGLHITFTQEAGGLLPLVIRGRVIHGRHFTFKSNISHSAVTFHSRAVTGSMASVEHPYAMKGPWVQCLLSDDLIQKMSQDFQILNSLSQVELPKTFSWPDHKLSITIVNE